MTVVLVEQDAELGQLCQAIEQLAEELNDEYFLVGVTAKVVSLFDGTL